MSPPLFRPRLALASLSGESDADWARNVEAEIGCAFLGGIALDDPTRKAAREMVAERDRKEFLPDDPFEFIDAQLAELAAAPLRPACNVRAVSVDPIRTAARICRDHGAILEVNAHCRQDEMCAAGSGESLLRDTDRLGTYVAAAADVGVDVSVKVRTELEGVALPPLARDLSAAGATAIHVDAMDSEAVVAEVVAAAPDLFVIANNGIRDARTTREYLAYGADAVSVGRASDRPAVLRWIRRTVASWYAEESEPADDRTDGEAWV